MRLYLIRHLPVLNASGLCYGQLDLPLQDEMSPHWLAGLQQQLPAQIPLFSSPLQRCGSLAAQLHPAPTFDTRLQELDFGEWEGRRWQDIGAATLDDWIASGYSGALYHGEGLVDLQQRVWQWADTTALQCAAAVAVTHAGVIRALWSRFAAMGDCLGRSVPHGEIITLDWSVIDQGVKSAP